MLNKSNVLVVDDKEEDGVLICNRLRSEFIPYQFFLFDEAKLLKFSEAKKISSVRVIFLDLQLISSGEPGTKDYDAAVSAVERLLIKDNGAWLLITWSTWIGDSSTPDSFAKSLFNHLRENLSPSLRPYDFALMDKSAFTIDGAHGEAKSDSNLGDDEIVSLKEILREKLASQPSLSLLCEWEEEAHKAASQTISEFTRMVSGVNDANSLLGNMLYEVALADSGKHVQEEVLSRSLCDVLTLVFRDKIDHQSAVSTIKTMVIHMVAPMTSAQW